MRPNFDWWIVGVIFFFFTLFFCFCFKGVATGGVYRCEVSVEGTFETDYREINLTVLGEW
jgi:hypothetical protein